MKTLYIKAFVVATISLLAAAGAFAQIKKVDIIATGLTCSMCSNAIYKQLESMPLVAEIRTDLNTNTFTVFFEENAIVRPIDLKQAVEKAGFFVGTMNLTMKVNSNQLDANSTLKTKAGTFVFLNHPSGDQEVQYRVLDKGFVTHSQYKDLVESYSAHPSFSAAKNDSYHLIAVKQ